MLNRLLKCILYGNSNRKRKQNKLLLPKSCNEVQLVMCNSRWKTCKPHHDTYISGQFHCYPPLEDDLIHPHLKSAFSFSSPKIQYAEYIYSIHPWVRLRSFWCQAVPAIKWSLQHLCNLFKQPTEKSGFFFNILSLLIKDSTGPIVNVSTTVSSARQNRCSPIGRTLLGQRGQVSCETGSHPSAAGMLFPKKFKASFYAPLVYLFLAMSHGVTPLRWQKEMTQKLWSKVTVNSHSWSHSKQVWHTNSCF